LIKDVGVGLEKADAFGTLLILVQLHLIVVLLVL